MDVIIVCHTEFGFVKNKKVIGKKEAVEGVSLGVKNLIELAEKYKAKVSFAVMPEVVDFFPKDIDHEVGLHIHPGWERRRVEGEEFYVGDSYLRTHCKQSSTSTVLWDYPFEEQFEMIRVGKELIIKKLGKVPRFFVGGRWCINNDTIKALIENGFTHECSAPAHRKTDHYDWSKLPRICMPYHPSLEDYQKEGDLPILEVPISQCFPRVTVSPENVLSCGLGWLKACFTEYYTLGLPLFHICLHSPAMTDNFFLLAMDKLVCFIMRHKNINFKIASEIKKYSITRFRSKTNILPYFKSINKDLLKNIFLKITDRLNDKFIF